MSDAKLRDDIVWMKQLAEEGRHAPLTGGIISIWWGVISFVMMLVQWGVLTGQLPLAIENLGMGWLVYSIIGVGGTAVLLKRIQEKPGAGSMSNRVSGAAWMMAGAGIFIFAIGVVIAVSAYGAPYWMFNTILPVAFVCYGIAFGVIGLLAGNRISGITAVISFGLALIMFLFLLTATLYLVAAFSILLITVLPVVAQKRAGG
jgi:hypothetical protein